MLVVESARRVWLVRGDTFTALPFFFYILCLADSDMVAVPNATSRRAKSASSKGAPKSQWGAHNVNNMGPHSNGGPKIL